MQIRINQFFTNPRCYYPFTGIFLHWVCQETEKRIVKSKTFDKLYSDKFHVEINLDAKPEIREPVIIGPVLNRRRKELLFSIHLPHDGKPISNNATDYSAAVQLLFECIVKAFGRIELDALMILKDAPSLIQEFVSKPQVIRVQN